jgi:hypothetical protein
VEHKYGMVITTVENCAGHLREVAENCGKLQNSYREFQKSLSSSMIVVECSYRVAEALLLYMRCLWRVVDDGEVSSPLTIWFFWLFVYMQLSQKINNVMLNQ